MDMLSTASSVLSGWWSLLRQASFKGAAFKVDTSDLNSGRRNAVHEYPQKDKPYLEDLGRNTRELRVEGWVIGENYAWQRDALLTACETPGAGELIHPHFGCLRVACTAVNVRESTSEQRMARFAMTFVESGELAFPTTILDSALSLANAASSVVNQQTDTFNAVLGINSSSNNEVSTLSQSLSSQLNALPLQFTPKSNAAFRRNVQNLQQPPPNYWHEPEAFSHAIITTLQAIAKGTDAISAFNHAVDLLAFSDGINGLDEQALAFKALVQLTALAEAAQLAAKDIFTTWDEALAARDTLIVDVDLRMAAATDAMLFTALNTLRAQLIISILYSTDLPRWTMFTPSATLPSLVLAYQLYGDASQADNIAIKNNIIRPGFIPGGYILQLII